MSFRLLKCCNIQAYSSIVASPVELVGSKSSVTSSSEREWTIFIEKDILVHAAQETSWWPMHVWAYYYQVTGLINKSGNYNRWSLAKNEDSQGTL